MVTYMASLAFFIPYRCNDCLRKDHLSTLVVGYLQANTGIVKMKQGIQGGKKISRLCFHFLKWEPRDALSPFRAVITALPADRVPGDIQSPHHQVTVQRNEVIVDRTRLASATYSVLHSSYFYHS